MLRLTMRHGRRLRQSCGVQIAGGLRRIERESGREVWINRDASRFLAANESFVYALDRNGKFFILDARRSSA